MGLLEISRDSRFFNICMFVGEYAIAGGGASNWDKESTKQRMITMCQIKNLIQRSKRYATEHFNVPEFQSMNGMYNFISSCNKLHRRARSSFKPKTNVLAPASSSFKPDSNFWK